MHSQTIGIIAVILFILPLSGCAKKSSDRIVIWTDRSEFAPYIELFNKKHNTKAVLVYKANPAHSLPPDGSSLPPDIIAGPWLFHKKANRQFRNLDDLFDRHDLKAEDFYPLLLDSGKLGGKTYLLPVSFNLPVFIFSREHENLIEDSYALSLEQVRTAGAAFNQKTSKDRFTQIGFAPQSSDLFLYTATKLHGAAFSRSKNALLTWDEQALDESLRFLKDWITGENESVQAESNFVYKYLSVTDDKRVTSGKTLFAFTTTDRLFQLTPERLAKLNFRWLQSGGAVPIEDSYVMMGIVRGAKNKQGAAEFISWFFNVSTQEELLERRKSTRLDIPAFGIAGGFSSLQEINERILPLYCTALLTNIPKADTFSMPSQKPPQWEKIKYAVIIPYLKDALAASEDKKLVPLAERYEEWMKTTGAY